MEPSRLPLPLLLRDGVLLTDPDGLRKLYGRLALAVSCRVPTRRFDQLAEQFAHRSIGRQPVAQQQPAAIMARLDEALNPPKFKWRTLERVAAAAAVGEEQAAHLLRSNAAVRFGVGKEKRVIVGLRSRVGN